MFKSKKLLSVILVMALVTTLSVSFKSTEVKAVPTYVNVLSYGAVADSTTDNTTAFTNAINAVAGTGGVVYVPAPDVDPNDMTRPVLYYKITGSLTVPANVKLVGASAMAPNLTFACPKWSNGRPAPYSPHWTKTSQWGSVLGFTGGAGNANGTPAITISGSNVELRGLYFYYPNQDVTSTDPNAVPTAYPWTVKTIGTTNVSNVVIENCMFINPYQAIYLINADSHLVRSVTGQPLKEGIRVEGGINGKLEAIEWHWIWTEEYWNWSGTTDPNGSVQPGLEKYAHDNGIGFRFVNGVNSEICRYLEVWGVGYPIWVEVTSGTSKPNVQFVNCATDDVREAVNIKDCNYVAFRSFEGYADGDQVIKTWSTNTGRVDIEGMIVHMGGPKIYDVNGTGMVNAECTITNIDNPYGKVVTNPYAINKAGTGTMNLISSAMPIYTEASGAAQEVKLAQGTLNLLNDQFENSFDVTKTGGTKNFTDNRVFNRTTVTSAPTANFGSQYQIDWPAYDKSANSSVSIPWDQFPFYVSVTAYGASTSNPDNTAAFQAALNATGRKGGGLVLVPPGTFNFKGNLIMPANTCLMGSWNAVPSWPSSDPNATILQVRSDTIVPNDPNQTKSGFLSNTFSYTPDGVEIGGVNNTVRNLYIYYPDQKTTLDPNDPNSPDIYPWAVLDKNDNFNVEQVYMVNPYRGISADAGSNQTLREIYGQPLKVGMYMPSLADWSEIFNIDFSQYSWKPAGSSVANWIQKNGTAFKFGRDDGALNDHLYAKGYYKGFVIDKNPIDTDNFYGVQRDVKMEDCHYPLDISKTYYPGIMFLDSLFTTPAGDTTAKCVNMHVTDMGASWAGHSAFANCTFTGAPLDINNEGQSMYYSGTVIFDNCTFNSWFRDQPSSYAVNATGGVLTITNSSFFTSLNNKNCASVGSNVLSAIVSNNASYYDFIVNQADPNRCTVTNNYISP